MRPRITKKFCASSTSQGKYRRVNTIVQSSISVVETTEIIQTKTVKQPFVKIFGRLLPLSSEEVKQFSNILTIIWL